MRFDIYPIITGEYFGLLEPINSINNLSHITVSARGLAGQVNVIQEVNMNCTVKRIDFTDSIYSNNSQSDGFCNVMYFPELNYNEAYLSAIFWLNPVLMMNYRNDINPQKEFLDLQYKFIPKDK